MKPAVAYAIGRLVFGIAALAVPGTSGPVLGGEGGGAPDAQAFLRGMGGREIGLGLGLLGAIRGNHPVAPWLVAGVLADCSDVAGIAGAWSHMPPAKRWLGVGMAGGTAAVGAALLARR